jgi:hypothetical protein
VKRFLLLVATFAFLAGVLVAKAGPAVKVCSWGGTPAAPTGELVIDRGLTLTPSAAPTHFRAWGTLTGGGRCHGQTMTFDGTIIARSTCGLTWFNGHVIGLAGVARFAGPGAGPFVHEFLYDKAGNVVGADQPQVQVPQPDGYSHAEDCATPEGFTKGRFSSTVELWG